jgi:hypothetical protein
MRLFTGLAAGLVLVAWATAPGGAQGQGGAAEDGDRAVADGGIFASGWQGRVDAGAAKQGMTVKDARLEQKGDVLHVKTGPAITYWNPANTASGRYTVKATFHEPQFMNINDHPHPYGLFVGGNDLDSDNATFLYCAAYGDGRFIVRGFGPAPFQMNGRRGGEAPSVNRAAGRGSPVTQEIAITVDEGNVSCAINGAVVATYPKSEVVADGRLKSTDGIYGIRFAHNTEGTVSGLSVTTN